MGTDAPGGWRRSVVVAMTAALSLPGAVTAATAAADGSPPAEAGDGQVDGPLEVARIAGPTRFDTVVRIARAAFPDGATTVHLARSDDVSDALAAGSLTDGPVLLVPGCDDVPAVVAEAIDVLDPDRVVALGGTAAICDTTLQAAAAGRSTDRLSGADRSATSAAIATAAFPDGAEAVYVAAVGATSDALAAGALTDGPVVLVSRSGPVSPAVLDALEELGPQRLVAIGGPAAVPDQVLATLAGERPTSRLAGPNRYATAAAIAAHAFPSGAQTVHLARSDDPVDAVAAGALATGPVLLVPSCGGVPAPVLGAIDSLGPRTVTALGGEHAVCPWALDRAAGRTAPDEPTSPLQTDDVHLLASRLAMAEATIRSADADLAWLRSMARWQHAIYRRLTVATHLRQAVVDRLPEPLRGPAWEQITAAAELRSMVTQLRDAPPDTWRIVEPPPVDELRGFYLEAEAAFGVPWQYLAAINLVETRFGKIQGTSTAGAQGPMQFMPGTWAAFGEGDVNDPRDAILAAARYLHANGAPAAMDRALFRYNRDSRYVRAVTRHADLLAAAPNLLAGYHKWEVWYLTTGGDVLLPAGWPQGQPAAADGGDAAGS